MNTHLTSELISSPSWPLSEPLPPWRILEIHPILHLQLFSGIWKKKRKKWCGIFKVSPGALLLDLLFPPRLFQLRFFKLCYLVISIQPQCTCLTLETKRAPSCHTAEWRWQERKLTQHSIGNQPWAVVAQRTRGNSAVQPGARTQSD